MATDPKILRYSRWDAVLIVISLIHPVVLLATPSALLVALGVWWNSNTISHHFLHLPFFRSGAANRLYSLYLSILLGIPQTLWRERHLAHHRGVAGPFRPAAPFVVEAFCIAALWGTLLFAAPDAFFRIYLPGLLLGLSLCYVHGYFEHVRGTTSNYGAVYNFAFFNDGYHAEHHEKPSEHWTRMRQMHFHGHRTSRWPAVLRWLEVFHLETLETLVMRSRILQWFLLVTHAGALRKLVRRLDPPNKVTIVGGGMFPRTAMLLRKFFPNAEIRILDENIRHLGMARPFLDDTIQLEHGHFAPDTPTDADLLVVPLSFSGCREALYRNPPAKAVLVHDWIWRKRGCSAIVSLFLLKRINLILR